MCEKLCGKSSAAAEVASSYASQCIKYKSATFDSQAMTTHASKAGESKAYKVLAKVIN